MAMRKAADAVAANAVDRAAAKRSKASTGLVVDIVASATVNAVHTWPMDGDMTPVGACRREPSLLCSSRSML